ncbi:MAG: glutathione S-transferase family protein [Rickettsiales bacterium]
MYRLYYSPGGCSMSVHLTLEELQQPYELKKIDLHKGEQRSPEFLKINPRGQIGALETEDGPMSENAAMIVYLNDKHNGSLIPRTGFARAKALQWLAYVNSTLHPLYGRAMFLKRNGADENLIKTAIDGIQSQWNDVETHLKNNGPYLAGENVTAGDLYLAVIANWDFIGALPKFGEKTQSLLKNVVARPSYRRAMESEGVQYKAVAA